MNNPAQNRLMSRGWFNEPGAYVLVDGQFGSTGKGLMSSALGGWFFDQIDVVTTNAGPNSGHTFYYHGEKHVLRQLPSSSYTIGLVSEDLDEKHNCTTWLNAGAIIDEDVLEDELNRIDVNMPVLIHPSAAMVNEFTVGMEHELKSSIGSTGKGTGGALARKVMRKPEAVRSYSDFSIPDPLMMHMEYTRQIYAPGARIFVETAQGYSLGINSGFYPFCTSRECTVAQALSDAHISPKMLQKVIMVCRTFPIRVGGNSGMGYPDQHEITWDQIGVEPETTTVTGKQRRLFTWSRMQFVQSLQANGPDVIFLNFMNYLDATAQENLIDEVLNMSFLTLGRIPDLLLGYGPSTDNIVLYKG